MANGNFSFTSESVCAGHPDKICDQISDAILDEVLRQDSNGRVAVECLAGNNVLIIAGEIGANAKLNFQKIAREQIKRLGYTNPKFNFSDKSPIHTFVHEQSPEIALGVVGQKKKGAGDQGMMFGFACSDTKEYMPMPITLAHALVKRIDAVREDKTLSYLRPDGKSQVDVEYKNNKPVGINSVVLAVPHDEKIELEKVKEDLYQIVVKYVLDQYGFEFPKEELIVNGTGVWHKGGPSSDCGLTGRKIVVDTYGGFGRVGGGCFSGKEPSKVDRGGAYAARYIAKNVVANGLAEKAEVRLAYFIGALQPLMQEVETFGTLRVSEKVLKDFVSKLLDTSVEGILEGLNLRRPIYLPTAAYGHFGRSEFPWEKVVRK